MFRTKKDVDKHVQDLLKKVSNETERKLLGFSFAKLYHQIGEQKLAKQHLASYLAVKETSSPAHRLAGQIAEALGERDAALRSYRRSYDLDSTQKDLVFKICALVCELPATPINRDLQQCWLERAEAIQPQHSLVYELKQRLMLSSGKQSEGQVEDHLKNEMMTKPSDMKLRVHLLKLYLDSNRIQEAYEHMLKIEGLQVFSHELDWYTCSLSVLDAYKQHADVQKLGPEYYCHLLNAVERAAFLKIARTGQGQKTSQSIGDLITAVRRLDETLKQASSASNNNGPAADVLLHFTCQFYFLTGLTLLLKAQAGLEEEQLILGFVATLFSFTYHQEAISSGNRSTDKKMREAWAASATYRRSQSGHCIVAWQSREGRKWVVDTVKKYDSAEGRRSIFESVFSGPCHSASFAFPRDAGQFELPSFSHLLELDRAAAQLNCDELHPVVWLGLRYYHMHRRDDADTDFAPDLSQILMACRYVGDLPFAASSWNSSAPETLSVLDVEAFVYATIFSSVSMDEALIESKGIRVVPATLTKSLCNDQQSAWWRAAVKLVTGSAKESLGELRRALQRGLEVIRLTSNQHGIPLELVAKLALTFMARAGQARAFPAVDVPAPISTDVLSVQQTEALEVQAGRYWKVFLDMVSSGNRYTPPLHGRLFEFRSTDCDLDDLIREGKLYSGYQMWRAGRREEAQRLLQTITDPYASYYQGLLFKEMAEEELCKGATVFESRSAANVLLNKSRDSLYITLDRLRSPGIERFHPLDQKLADTIEKVETKLSGLTSQSVANGHTTDEEAEESEEREFATPQAQQVTSTPHRRNLMLGSSTMRNGTPIGSRLDVSTRAEARPSPERLDAQLRQMVLRQEEFNQTISNELKQIRSEVVDIKTLIQKLESHLEIQAKQEPRGGSGVDRGKKPVYEDYEEWEGEEQEGEEDEEEEDEETDLDNLVRLKGKLKGSGSAGGPPVPPVNLPLYAPPFAPSSSVRPPAYGYPPAPGYGAPFHPSAYAQYPGFPGYMGVPSPVGAFPVTPGYSGYPPGMPPHWDAAAASPGPSGFLPGATLPIPPTQPIPPAVAPAPVSLPAPAPAPAPSAPSVFSRLGMKEGAAPVSTSAAPPQQPLVINDLDSASEALRRAAANSQVAPHAYQINLPVQKTPEKSVVESKLATPTQPLPTRGLLANIPEPQYSSVTSTPSPGKDKSLVKTPVRDRKQSSCSEGSNVEEEVDNYPDFKPIIPLPEEVEVKTGEEGEDVLFDQRSKLFRFVDREWKERGVGQLKLLQDPSTKKIRLLMRRDQVLKICANHYITPDIKLSKMKAGPNSWIWAALDFADGGEGKLEKFVARFKTDDQSEEFRKAFEKAQVTVAGIAKTPTKPAAETAKTQQGFGDKFAPKAGTWACSICYVNNTADAVKCAACETPKPGAAPAAAATTPAASFKFGVAPATTTPASTAAPSSTGFSFATPAATSGPTTTPTTGFKFGVQTTPSATPTTTPITVPAATSAAATTPTASFKFGVQPSSAATLTTTPAIGAFGSGITFGTPGGATAAGATKGTGSIFGTPVSSTSSPAPFSFSTAAATTAAAVSTAPTPSTAAFSFTLPTSSATTTTVTKAPFSFSPPKLAVATAKTNGEAEVKPAATTTTTPFGANFASGPLFGTPKTTPTTTPTTPSVFSSSVFGTPKPPSEGPKPMFGGSAFGGTPAPATTIEGKNAEVKPSPFAGFSFQATTPVKDSVEKKPESGMLFSLLAQKAPSTGFAVTPQKEFPGTGTPLFTQSVKPAKEAEQEENEEGENEEGEYEPTVAFEPVIPLPALVEVSTGEEEENVLFSDRAFLYRYVPDTKEWKEKGRGDMKILEHKTTGRIRLLMRREQVLKICCNHYITPQLSLKPLQTSDRTWTWSAQDFSEGELVQETFALKFKTSDQAQKFKTVFDEAHKKITSGSPSQGSPAAVTAPKAEAQPAATKSLAEMFKPKEGSWECQGCFLRNAADVIKCPSCETVKPGATVPPAAEKPATPAFSFGTSGGGFTFAAATPTAATSAPPTTGFGGFTFSLTPTAAAASPAKGQQAQVTKTGRSPNVSVGSDNEYYEEEGEGNDIHFEPVIPLPEKIQVKTGEEDEEVVYCHRAKLLRLVDREWKERGIGDVKVLRHPATGKTRLLMRREQILKICLNHALTPDLVFKSKDEKSWLWAAKDFAEGDGRMETFVIRFRDADIAKAFMAAVQESQKGVAEGGAKVPTSKSDEVEMIFAKEATEEQKRKARELMLPLNFFLYETAPPCPGCRGCEPEDSDEATAAKPASSSAAKPDTAAPKLEKTAFGNGSFMKAAAESSVSQLSFSALATTAASGFSKPASFSWSGAGKPVFGAVAATAAAQPEEKSSNNADEEDGEVPESNDPHFEPIIPLPDLVEVKTGEEDEEAVFSHRAKLYRFESSSKEWKEKGVGDIKILRHREKNTYRILLRRDQIHKLACNHWLTTEMSLKPLSTSTTAWTWFAMDFSQGELVSEHFAVRFKTVDTAALFKRKFEESQAALKNAPARSEPSSNSTPATVIPQAQPSKTDEQAVAAQAEEEAADEDQEDEQDEEDYEDVEESIMFEKRCTLSSLEGEGSEKTWVLLGTGNLKIVYDDEMLCARIVVEDVNEQLLCDNVIAIETELKVDGKECVWSAIDYSSEESARRTFRSQFASTDAALEFQSTFAEAKQFAEKSEVHDEPDLHAAGYDHSNDDHGDYDDQGSPSALCEGTVTCNETQKPMTPIRACDPRLAQALSDILNDLS